MVTLPLKLIDEGVIDELEKFSSQKASAAKLKFMVHDREDNLYIQMFSRNRRIEISDQLISFLQDQPEIDFKLN